MKIHFFKSPLLIIVLLSCSDSDDCGPAPPCAPPRVWQNGLNFQLLNAQGSIIDLKEEHKTSTFLTSGGFSEALVLDTGNDRFQTFLQAINFERPPKSQNYTLTTAFGADQNLKLVIGSDWTDECQFCKDYFITEVIQNNTDTLFTGRFNKELIQISIK